MAVSKFLEIVDETVEDRRKDYGDPVDNFQQVAQVWSILLGVKISATDVANCMIALKLCRLNENDNDDTYIDIAGYAALAYDMKMEEVLRMGEPYVD